MTDKEKQLLLKVLCAGLNYDIKGRVFAETSNGEFDIMGDMIFNDEPFDVVLDEINVRNGEIRVTAIEDDEKTRDFIDSVQDWEGPYTIETFKPYLRPMSSMTWDERFEHDKFVNGSITLENHANEIDWLTSKHFDYLGIIPMGLALPAPDGMYNN